MPNRLLELYRQKTNDPATDDELILKWGKELPQAMEMEDFRADYQRLTKQPEMPAYEPTVGDYFKQAIGSAGRAVAGGIASLPEAIGIGAAGLSKATGIDDQLGEGDSTKAEDRLTYKIGQFIREKAADITPEPVEGLENSMVATKIPAGLGSAASFVAGGAAGKALKIPSWITTAMMGSASGATGFYEDAKANGADDKEAYLASLFGAIVGTSEAIPMAKMVNRLDGISGNAFSKTLIEAGKETFEEALQEASQQFAQNFTAKKLYDADRKLLDGVAENATVGGATGFLFSLLTQAVGKHIGPRGSSSSNNQPGLTPQPAGVAPAQAAPAAPPAIPQGMEMYTEKPDGTQPTESELEQLQVMARMELAGEINLLGKQYLDTMPAGMRTAYELIKSKLAEATTKSESISSSVVDPTVKESLTVQPEARAEGDSTISNPATAAETSSTSSSAASPDVSSSATVATTEPSPTELDYGYGGEMISAPELPAAVQVRKEVTPNERQVQEGRQEKLLVAPTDSAETQMTEKPPQTITGSNVQTGTEMPVQQAAAGGAISPTQPEVAPVKTRDAQDVLDEIDLEYAVQRKRHGVASERAFFDLDPQPYSLALADKLTSLFRDQTSRALSKQLVYFQAPDGKVYGLHSAKVTKSLASPEYRITIPPGMVVERKTWKGKGGKTMVAAKPSDTIPLQDLMARGFVPIASSMGSVSHKYADRSSSVVFGSREQFDEFRSKAYEKLDAELVAAPETALEDVSDDETPKATSVTTETPFDELAAQEGFTKDEAYILWPFISGTKMDEVSGGIMKAARSEDGRAALLTLYKTLINSGALDEKATPEETYSTIGFLIARARQTASVGKEAFAKSLAQLVGEAIDGGNAGAATAKASATSSDAGTDAGTTGGGEQAAEADDSGEEVDDDGFELRGETVEGIAAQKLDAENQIKELKKSGYSDEFILNESSAGERIGKKRTREILSGASTQAGTDERFHTGTINARYRPQVHQVAAQFQNTLLSAANAGLNVTVLQQEAAGLGYEAGVANPASREIALALSDVNQPSIDNLYHLNAEIAHTVFADLKPAVQVQLQKSIQGVTDGFLGITNDFKISPAAANPDAVLQEERLVDTVSRKLIMDGFTPTQARGLASRFWRALKAVMLRASMAMAKAFGFSAERQASIATEYLQVRVEQFLSGTMRPWGFVDYVGGNRLRPQDANRLYPFSSGYSAVNFRYDAETGATLVQEVSPESGEALFHNLSNPTVRYHSGRNADKISPDTSGDVALYGVAANNELNEILNGLYAAWDSTGKNVLPSGGKAMDAEQFKRWLMGGKQLPTEAITDMQARATAVGVTPPNVATRLQDLNMDAQREAANRVYERFSKFIARLRKRYEEAAFETSMEPGSEQRLYHRNALTAITLTSKINDTNAVMDEIKQGVTAMVRFLNKDVAHVSSLSHRRGMYAEMIRSLEGDFTADIGRQYAQAMNAIVRRFSESATESTNFVNILAKIADMPAYFGSSDAATIRNFIKNSPDPEFAVLKQDTTDSRALLTIAVGFAKRNALLLNMLSVRRLNAQANLEAEKKTLQEAINIAMGSSRTASKDALRYVDKLVVLKEKATRIIVELENISNQQRVLNDNLQAHRRFMDFYEDARRPLNERLAVYERMIGAVQEIFEPYPGATMFVPENANSDPELAANQTKVYSPERDDAMTADLQASIDKMQAWMDAHPAGTPYHQGAFYNRLAMQVEKLKENVMQGQVDKGSRNLVSAVFGSMVEKFERTGDPRLKQIARSMRNFESWHLRYKQEEHTWATNWSKAAVKARAALGYSSQQMDVFLRNYYDASLDYISRRLDIQASSVDSTEAVERGLAAIKARYPQLNNEQWIALEGLLRETINVSDSILKASDDMGNLIKDERTGIYRKVRGARLFELMRTYNGEIQRVFKQMAGEPGKPGLWTEKPFDFDKIASELSKDKAAARKAYADYFRGEIWDTFLAPIANRAGRAAFHAPDDGSGIRSLSRVADVQAAFRNTQHGDIVGFAENLYALSGGNPAKMDPNQFIVDVMKTVHQFYKSRLSAMVSDQSAGAAMSMAPLNQALMTARVTDEDPAEWLEHRRFDIHSVRSLMQQLTLHASFGRNIAETEALFRKAEEELADKHNILETQVIRPVMETPGIIGSIVGRQGRMRRAAKERAAKLGYDLTALERSSQQLAMLRYERDNFRSFVQSQGGIAMEFKWWSQLMSAFVSWTVQGPKTALVDTNSLLKPIQEIGLSTQSLQWFGSSAKHTALQNIGGFLELFGVTLKTEADMIRMLHEHGQYPSSDLFTYKDRMLTAVMGNPVDPGASKLSRVLRGLGLGGVAAREILSSPLPSPLRPNDPKFVKVKPAVFTQVGQTMHLGAVAGTWRTFEDMVIRAARFLNDPTRLVELNDPAFRFDRVHAKFLGYGDKFFGLLNDERAFESMLHKLNQNGLTLEQLARDYVGRGMVGPVMSNDAYRKLIVIGPSEIMQESSIVSRPSWMVTNPIGRTALPLVGWSMSQTASIGRSFGKEISGEYAGFKKWMWKLAPILGVGLAYSFLSDWWDEEILKKKTNRLSLDGDNVTAALVDRMSASGVLGIAGDFANSFINVSTAREFSIDSRVFAVSSFTGIFKALSTYYHQGSATYATVGRPLLQAMGGSGAIQYLQVINGITGSDNQEARATARVNVNNWLRVTGRRLEMEVKTAKGGDFVPNRTTPYVRDMVLAAYANNYADFFEAYRKAVVTAREDKRENPEDYVKRAFQYQHPLKSVFKTVPGEKDYAALLREMPEGGRHDVTEAVNLFNRYGVALGLDPFTGQKSKPENPLFKRNALLKLDAGRLLGGF